MLDAERQKLACVITEGHTASTDYFIQPYLDKLSIRSVFIDLKKQPSADDILLNVSLIIISRYLHSSWYPLLHKAKCKGVSIAYFMDDDLFDWTALRAIPLRYKWKIFRMSLLQKHKLIRLCDDIWVSNQYLAEKYSILRPTMLFPEPLAKPAREKAMVRVCYHGTASHTREIAWLKNVMSAVQLQASNTIFELFGGGDISKQFRSVPRVSVINAMSWPDYYTWSSVEHREIALAPLLPGGFNDARGPTKFFDYSRLGAVGVYSNVAPYRGYIRDGIDGLLLDNDPELWIECILDLVDNVDKRRSLAQAASVRVNAMSERLL